MSPASHFTLGRLGNVTCIYIISLLNSPMSIWIHLILVKAIHCKSMIRMIKWGLVLTNSVVLTCKHQQQQQSRAEGGLARPTGQRVLVDRGEGSVPLHDGDQHRVRHQVLCRYVALYLHYLQYLDMVTSTVSDTRFWADIHCIISTSTTISRYGDQHRVGHQVLSRYTLYYIYKI